MQYSAHFLHRSVQSVAYNNCHTASTVPLICTNTVRKDPIISIFVLIKYWRVFSHPKLYLGLRGRDRTVVGLKATYAISTYHH